MNYGSDIARIAYLQKECLLNSSLLQKNRKTLSSLGTLLWGRVLLEIQIARRELRYYFCTKSNTKEKGKTRKLAVAARIPKQTVLSLTSTVYSLSRTRTTKVERTKRAVPMARELGVSHDWDRHDQAIPVSQNYSHSHPALLRIGAGKPGGAIKAQTWG